MNLAEQFSAYGRWREAAAEVVARLGNWLASNEMGDAQAGPRLQHLLERLREDRLTVAFVAEFSRGKSELINAIFFAGHGDRVLPSSAGRTTMCPTELCWRPGDRPELRLLPIRSRARRATVGELRLERAAWQVVPLVPEATAELRQALARVGETERVAPDEALALGFAIDPGGEKGLRPGPDGRVEIPAWRHAIVHLPHPLLAQGLVVLDTPGLNAIGAEPELTLSLLPSAHAVLFVLAADTGVTHSDLAMWRDYVEAGGRGGRLVVLNKIDGLWDGLRAEGQIEAELCRQVKAVAETLAVDAGSVFPVSAQKALVARVGGDEVLLARSRLPALERALSAGLLPARRQVVRADACAETDAALRQARALLDGRLAALRAQLHELDELRGRNRRVIEYMLRKIESEKAEFELGLQKYHAVRSVFSDLSNSLLARLGMDGLRDETRRTREAMLEAAFSAGLRAAMERFFTSVRGRLNRAAEQIGEIVRMLEAMHRRFSVEHGLRLDAPEALSIRRYEDELDQLEAAYRRQINSTLSLVTTEKHALTQRFFDTVALQARRIFQLANRDVEQWLRAAMGPLEAQVREYRQQLRHRLDGVKRVHEATGTLDERLDELKADERSVLRQLDELARLERTIAAVLGEAGPHAVGEGEVAIHPLQAA
jgi:hypothetical protein